MDWSIPVIILQLIFLECILSIDNAAVLGAMVVDLPDDQPVHWNNAFLKIGKVLNPILGNQRTAALRVGLLGAYVLRGAMLFLVSLIIQNQWIKVVGAIYLIRLAFENLSSSAAETDEDGDVKMVKTRGFWELVIVLNIADMIFSIDNVVAAVSLSNKLWVVMLGVAIGILVMRFAAGWFSYAIEKEPILQPTAFILIFNIGVELLLTELIHIQFSDWMKFGISISTIILALLYEHLKPLRVIRPVLRWISRGFGAADAMLDWALEPVLLVLRMFKWLVLAIYHVFKPEIGAEA
jgi:tellurite resistance protein TerC